jgi:hypothetical protein
VPLPSPYLGLFNDALSATVHKSVRCEAETGGRMRRHVLEQLKGFLLNLLLLVYIKSCRSYLIAFRVGSV